ARDPYGVSPTSVSIPGCFWSTASKLPPPLADVAVSFWRRVKVPGMESGGGSSAAVGGAGPRGGGASWCAHPATARSKTIASALARITVLRVGPLGLHDRQRQRS